MASFSTEEVGWPRGREHKVPKKRTVMAAMVVAGLLAAFSLAGVAFAQGTTIASAELRDPQGNPVGTAEFIEGPSGVAINVNITGGVEPGEHGIHIHETGAITPSFEAAGGHFNPTGNNHGFESPNGPHAGDLENIVVGPDGTASYSTVNERVTLSGGPNSLLDAGGSALVVHAMPDDYVTDPSGDSGDRVAAGVIEATASLPETGGPSPLVLATALLLAGAALLLLGPHRS
jgi:Cu-Zn family superoxide dismutase